MRLIILKYSLYTIKCPYLKYIGQWIWTNAYTCEVTTFLQLTGFTQPSVLGNYWSSCCYYRYFWSHHFETQLKLNFCIPSDLAIWLLGMYTRETLTHVHRKQAHESASQLLAAPILAVHCSCCLCMLMFFDSLFPFPFPLLFL